MAAGATIKLTFLTRRRRLPAVAGQPVGSSFGIVWDIAPVPPGGLCYVVEFLDRSRASVLGVITNNARVYRVDRPCSAELELDDVELMLVRDRGSQLGDVYVRDMNGRFVRVTGYTGAVNGTMREVHDEATWNTEHSLPYQEFMAMLFLRYCLFGGTANACAPSGSNVSAWIDLHESVALFEGFTDMALPDAIESLMYRIRIKERPAGLERFAYRLLSRIDLQRLRQLTVSCGAKLVYIKRMNGFYINFNHEGMSPESEAFLLSVEAVLNRILSVLDAIGCGLSPVRVSPLEEECAGIDRSAFERVTEHVGTIIARDGDSASDLRCPGTVACERGGEWDVRVSFAGICEGLNLISRLEYRFDYRAHDGLLSVRIVRPAVFSMPSEVYDERAGAWRILSDDERGCMAREYGCRMSLVVAAAAFASGLNVRSCVIEEKDVLSAERTSRRFERAEFLAAVVPLAAELVGIPLVGCGAVATMHRFEVAEGFERVASPAHSLPPQDDARALPAGLRGRLLADEVRELDVEDGADEDGLRRFHALRAMLYEDPQRAVDGLNKLIEEAQASCAAAELMADVPMRTQYCENHIGRIILPVFIDDASVRIHRAPDTLFFSQYELCNLYARMGAYDRALPEARHLLDLAVTSMPAHFTLINVLARLEMFDEVVEVAKHGLRIAFEQDAISYLFYRLAFAYWRLKEHTTALACYTLVSPGEQISRAAREETAELMRSMGRTDPMDFEEARSVLEAAGIPMPPTDEVCNRVADAAVMLADSGFLYLAGRCAFALYRMRRKDEFGIVGRSMLL